MPNGLPHDKKYGHHKYPRSPDGTSDCAHGCGCWAGPTNSGGPTGLNPFGECPQNPEDGKLLGGDDDHRCVVEKRIRQLESEKVRADELENIAGTEKIDLSKRLTAEKQKLFKLKQLIANFQVNVSGVLEESKEEPT